jgi:hypothetical protein
MRIRVWYLDYHEEGLCCYLLDIHRKPITSITAVLLPFVTYLLTPLICTNPIRTSQETHYISATKPNRLMLFRETVAVYCENHTEHTGTLCGKNAEFCYFVASGIYSDHWALKR